MTDHPLYLPAPLIPAFMAGRVSLLVEPLEVPDYRLVEVRVLENWAIFGNCYFGLVRYVPLPHAPGDRLVMDGAWAEVEEVEVKRVQDVTEGEAWSAGCKPGELDDYGNPFPAEEPHPKGGYVGWDCARDWLADLFDATYGPDAWDRNPWCTFTRIKVHMGSFEEKG